jgi:hypothetical protein
MVMAVAVITMLLGAVEEDKRKAAAVIRNMRGMLVCFVNLLLAVVLVAYSSRPRTIHPRLLLSLLRLLRADDGDGDGDSDGGDNDDDEVVVAVTRWRL